MVTWANKKADGIGGHISTYASIAELYEVGFNHFFRGPEAGLDRDLVFFQGHSSPGIYARAFLEGRLSQADLENFRREVHPPVPGGRGLSSYPHPWLMPDFWEFPTVSMGLGPIQAIYQARFMRYLEDRGLKPKSSAKVWAFLGDGEHDEPETVGALHLAARENLDNLIFVVNCNLQRLDGPVRGNSKVIQELERLYRGAGWRVIKVVWGSAWDQLLAKDREGHLLRRFEALVDGESQRYAAFGGKELRERFFNTPELKRLIEGMTDEELTELTRSRGGHDLEKIYAAYKAAVEHKGSPVVILARTIKGYGMGPTAMAKNVAHQVKKLTEEDLKEARAFLGIPIPEEKLAELPYYHPGPDSEEVRYLLERRKALGGFVPERRVRFTGGLEVPGEEFFREFYEGSGGREISTTMAFVRILAKLLRHPVIGKLIVPIVPDEARTFGMEALIAQVGVYSPSGPALHPRGRRNPHRLQGEQGGADPGGGHHRGRSHGGVHRRRHGLRPLWHPHHSLLHHLLHVRPSEDRGPGLGRRRPKDPGLLSGGHGGADHPGGGGPAAPGRPEPHLRPGGPPTSWPTTRPSPTSSP
jgi:pyruvate dehydrogenase E1 component